MRTITDTQMKILVYIATYADEHGHQPSYRQIANHFGWTSLGYISHVLRQMKKRGVISDTGTRAVRFVGDWRDFVEVQDDVSEPQPAG